MPKAEHQKQLITDAQERIISHSAKKPSAPRLKQVLRRAAKSGATRAGLVADVGKF